MIKSGGIKANGNVTINAPLGLSTAQSWTVASGKLLTVGGTVDTNARLLTITEAGDTAISGIISSTGSLTKTGAGLLTLSGANTYTGVTTLAGGILNLAIAETPGTSGPLGKPGTTVGSLVFSGGSLQYSSVNATDYSGRFSTVGSQLWNIDTNARDVSYATALVGTGSSLTKHGNGILTLASANTFTGGTTISAGTLNVTGTLADTGAVTVSGGTYTVANTDTIGVLTLVSGTINGGGTLTGSSYGVQSGTISAILAGSGIGLTKSTTGIVTLSAANSYTGATAVNAGTLIVNGTLNAGSAMSLAAGVTLSGVGTVGGTVTVANSLATTIIAGNGASGALTLGSLNFLGAGTIQIGTLTNYTDTAALNVTGTLTLAGAAGAVTLALPAGTVSEGTYHLIGSTLTNLTGFAITGATLGTRQTSQLVNTAGKIDYVVVGANPYWTGALGTGWSTTTLAAPKNWALSESLTTDFIASDAVLFDDRATTTTVSIAANVSPNVVSFSNSSKNYLLQGAAGIASGSLTKSGGGTLTIANTNTYSGGTTLYAGVLKVGTNGALGSGSLTLNSGTLSSDSTTARTLANALFVNGNMVLGDAATNGALTFSGTVNLGAAARQLTTASDVILAGVIGNGGLVKAGAGTLTLSGTNTYTGGTVLTGGTLAVNSAASLGDSSGILTFAGNSSLLFNASYSITRDYSINTSVTATLNSNGFELTQISVASGGGGLNKIGAGTFTLSGTNLYSGDTTVSGGTLALSGGSAIPDNGIVSVANSPGATLLLNASETIGALTGGGTAGGVVNLQSHTLTVGNTASRNFAGVISGTGSLIKTNTGTLTLSGNSTFSGATTINNGTLSIAADSALGGVPGSATPGKLVLGGGTLATSATLILNSNRGLTTGGTIDVAAGTTLTYGGIAAGTGSLIKNGNGLFILSGANSYSGATTVSAGNLAVNGSLVSAVTVASDATLSGTGTVASSVTASDNAIITAGNGVSGSLTISGGLTFVGDGLIQIGTLANYTGSAAINAGVLTNLDTATIIFNLPAGSVTNGSYHLLSHSNNLNANTFNAFSVTGPTAGARQSATLANNNGMIDYVVAGDTPYWTGSAGSTWNTAASNWKLVSAGTVTQFLASDAVLFNDNATGTTTVDIAASVNPAVVTFVNSSKNYTVQGAAGITTGSLSKSGSGILTITNSNSYNEGTTLIAGVLQIGNNSALGTGIVALNGGTLSSDSTTARTLSNSISIGGDVTLGHATQNGALTLSGGVDLGGAVRQIGTASNVTLSGSLTNGGLAKAGSGTLTLTGTNTYSGATSVSLGKLVVNGSLASATTTISSGATLGGSGTIAGATTIQSGAIHAPGNSPGLQTFTDLTYADGSIFSWEIDRTLTQTRGTGYDAVNVSGALAGLDGADLNTTTDAIFRIVISDSDFSNSFWNTPRTWTDIFTGADGSTAKVNWASVFGGGFQFYNTSGGAIAAPVSSNFTLTGNTLSWSAVPEPTSALAGLLLGAGLLRRRRRLTN